MTDPSPQERSAWQDWNAATKPLVEALTRSDKHGLHHNDRFAWLLQQFGHFDRNEIDHVDHSHLKNELFEIAVNQLNDLRNDVRDVLRTLLMLWLAPAADMSTLIEWRHQLGDSREKIAAALTNSPSLRQFLPAIIEIAWKTARGSTVRALNNCNYVHREIRILVIRKQRDIGDWNQRLSLDCPWSLIEIIAYDPDDPNDCLLDARYLPFVEPLLPSADSRT